MKEKVNSKQVIASFPIRKSFGEDGEGPKPSPKLGEIPHPKGFWGMAASLAVRGLHRFLSPFPQENTRMDMDARWPLRVAS
jgi:hypothetical protein